MNGDVLNRDVSISQENRQRSKILSSNAQIQERVDLLFQKKMDRYTKLLALYTAEQKIHSQNTICEEKIVSKFAKHWNERETTMKEKPQYRELLESNVSFNDIAI